ncbi:MAG: F0F1 ATP synthase subunit delta [Thermomicrobiales bacterium]
MASGVAKRYAQAVFSLAKEQGTLGQWQSDLALLNDVASNAEVSAFLKNPTTDGKQKAALLETVLENGGGQAQAKNLARLLVEKQRLDIIPELYELFEESMLAEQGIVYADVTTAEPLSEAGQTIVQEKLSELIGKQVRLRTKVDPSIIGGIIALVGDQLIDGSVINQLRQLRERLSAA